MLLSAAKPRYARTSAGVDDRTPMMRPRAVVPGRWPVSGLAVAALLLAGQSAAAQSGKSDAAPSDRAAHPPSGRGQARAKLNQETLVIAAGRPGTSYMAMAGDLAAALAASGGVRLLPIQRTAGWRTCRTCCFCAASIWRSCPPTSWPHARTTNALGGALSHRLVYVTALYSESVHVIAGRGIAAIGDLRGRKVAVPAGDGTVQFTASDIFKRLGIAVESVPMEPADALEEVRDGKIAAVVLVGGKPLARSRRCRRTAACAS